MAFDIGAGLAEAGKSVAQTAQAYTLESQKAELEQEKIKLADQLAGARQEKQNVYNTSERVATQAFTGEENTKNRTNAMDIAQTNLKGQLAHAGAIVAAAHETATSHLAGIQKQLDALAPEREATVETRRIENQSKAMQLNAQTDYLKALQAGDVNAQSKAIQAMTTFDSHLLGIKTQLEAGAPERAANLEGKTIENDTKRQMLTARNDYLTALGTDDIAAQTKAIQMMAAIEFSPKDQRADVALYQTQARLVENVMIAAQSKLATLQANMATAMTPAGEEGIRSLSEQVRLLRGQYQSAIRTAQDLLDRLPNSGRSGAGGRSGGIDLNDPKYQMTPAGTPILQRPINQSFP